MPAETQPHIGYRVGQDRHIMNHGPQVTSLPCPFFALVLDRQLLSSPNSLTVAPNGTRIFFPHRAPRPYPFAHAPLQCRPIPSIAFPPCKRVVCDLQIPIAHTQPPAVSSNEGFRTPALAWACLARPRRVGRAGIRNPQHSLRNRSRPVAGLCRQYPESRRKFKAFARVAIRRDGPTGDIPTQFTSIGRITAAASCRISGSS
jgi:hypothetical protein